MGVETSPRWVKSLTAVVMVLWSGGLWLVLTGRYGASEPGAPVARGGSPVGMTGGHFAMWETFRSAGPTGPGQKRTPVLGRTGVTSTERSSKGGLVGTARRICNVRWARRFRRRSIFFAGIGARGRVRPVVDKACRTGRRPLRLTRQFTTA